MPVYDRQCATCEELFEVVCKISEKDNGHECPYCGDLNGYWRPVAPNMTIRSDRLMTHKSDNGFKEVLSKIQERNKRTEICQR
jgi:putative FmdB family regulatory protein